MAATKKVLTTIRYSGPGTQPPIFLAGSFSVPEWTPEEMQYTTDEQNEHEFYREIEAEEGKEYQYKFRVGLGDWWTLNEGSPTATDNAGNRNNILSIPHQKVEEKNDPKEQKNVNENKRTDEPAPSSPFLPLAHEPSSVSETLQLQEKKVEQFDGSVDDHKVETGLPAKIESLTSSILPVQSETQQKNLSPEAELLKEEVAKSEDDPSEDTNKPTEKPPTKVALDIQDKLHAQNSETEGGNSSDHDSQKLEIDAPTKETKEEEKVSGPPSTSSETSDPVTQSDHTDDSFVLVRDPKSGDTETGQDAGETDLPKVAQKEFPTPADKLPEYEAVAESENVEAGDITAKGSKAGSVKGDELDTGITSADESVTSGRDLKTDKPLSKSGQNPFHPDEIETSKFVVDLGQSFDGSVPPAPAAVTPIVAGTKQLSHTNGEAREISQGNEGPQITVEPATPGPANPKITEQTKQVGATKSSAVDNDSQSQVTKRSKKNAPISERAVSPSSMGTVGRDGKPGNLLKALLHLVFVEWVGKFFGKLWTGLRRQPRKELLTIAGGSSVAVIVLYLLYG